jgi:hypothetical protein
MLQNVVRAMGTIEESSAPIDCELQFQPTMQLQNGLPYSIKVTLKVRFGIGTAYMRNS